MADRWSSSAAFEAKVSLGSWRVRRRWRNLRSGHRVHPNLITKWKRQVAEKMVEVFLQRAWPRRWEPRGGDQGAACQDRRADAGARFLYQDLRSPIHGRTAVMVDPRHPRLSIGRLCALVSISQLVVLLRGQGGGTGEPVADSPDRRAVPGDAAVRLAPNGPTPAASGLRRRMQAGAPAHGPLANLPEIAPRHRVYPHPVRGAFDRTGELGLVRRRDLHPDAPGHSLPGGCPTHSIPSSAPPPWRKHSRTMASPRSSTPTRAANPPTCLSHSSSRTPESGSPWTARGVGWTTS